LSDIRQRQDLATVTGLNVWNFQGARSANFSKAKQNLEHLH